MLFRNLQPGEAILHRNLRLAALRDSPQSFGQRYEEAINLPPSYWEDLTRTVTLPNTQIMILACEDNVPVGTAYGLNDRESPTIGHVGGMWVNRTWRRKGIGKMILEEILRWANDRPLSLLKLWAPMHEPGALALYRQSGFSETGQRRPFPVDADLEILEMSLELSIVN